MDKPLEHFGLKARPFEIVTDPRYFFPSREHDEALSRLLYLVNQESMYFGMLTGEIGSGKSITRKVFAQRIDRNKHHVVEFENSAFSFGELMRQLLTRSGCKHNDLPAPDERAALFEMVAQLSEALHREQDRQLVILFDEAQDLAPPELENLKRLSNLNGEVAGSITIILIGQPELRGQVASLPPLDQRISLRFHLPNLGEDEIENYLRTRLRVAGHADGNLFAEETFAPLYRASRGIPREINRLAKLALDLAAANSQTLVQVDCINQVIADLQRQQAIPQSSFNLA